MLRVQPTLGGLQNRQVSDFELPAASWEKTPRARKEHQCYECREKILPGETYRNVAGIWNGEFEHYKFCNGCEALRGILRSELNVECAFGELFETLNEFRDDLNAMEVLGAMGA